MDTGKIMHMDEQLEKVPGGTVLPYVVQPGDSLRMIANKYHVSIEQAVYAAADEQATLNALDTFAERWDKKYPKISQSWRENWANLSTYFRFPQEVRRLIYTTNAIEGFNRQLRKVTKSKSVFPTDDSLFKMLYLAMLDNTKKWTGRRQDWSMIYAQLVIFFGDRIPE